MSEIDVIHVVLDDLGLSQGRVVLVGGLAVLFYTGAEVSKDVGFADVFGTRDIVNDHLKVLEEYVSSNFPGRPDRTRHF